MFAARPSLCRCLSSKNTLPYFLLLNFLTLWKEKDWDLEKRYCVVTFDDGWRDNFLFAFPVQRRYRRPATIFVPTAQWFWPDKLTYLLLSCTYINSFASERVNALNFLSDRAPWLNLLDDSNGCGDKDGSIESAKSRPAEEIEWLLDEASRVLRVKYPTERMFVHWGGNGERSKDGISFGSHSYTHRLAFCPLRKQKGKQAIQCPRSAPSPSTIFRCSLIPMVTTRRRSRK